MKNKRKSGSGSGANTATRSRPTSGTGAKSGSGSGVGVRSGARSVARKLAMQALYEWQLNDQPWQDLYNQYLASDDIERADREYFRELIESIGTGREGLDAQLKSFTDRPLASLDPIEHAILLIGLYELQSRLEVPYRVAINEGVELAKRFGATEAHKYVNAVLDKAASKLRPEERR